MRFRFLVGIACLLFPLAAQANSNSFKDSKLFRFKCYAPFQMRRHMADTSSGYALLLKHEHDDIWKIMCQYRRRASKTDTTLESLDPLTVFEKDTLYAITFDVGLMSMDRDMIFQLDFSEKVHDPNEERKALAPLPDTKATLNLRATKLKKDIKLTSIYPDVTGKITAKEGKETPPVVTFSWHGK